MPSLACSCWTCRHPTPDNAGVRNVHELRHEQFQDWLQGSRVMEGFTPPPVEAIAVMTYDEWNPPSGACKRSDHAMLAPHPRDSHR